MSAYSEWKYGLITDAEYNHICREEEFWDRYYTEHPEELEDDDEDYREPCEWDLFDDDELMEDAI